MTSGSAPLRRISGNAARVLIISRRFVRTSISLSVGPMHADAVSFYLGRLHTGVSAAQVSIGTRQPVLSRRIEYIDVESVFERHRAMRQVRRDHEYFTGADNQLALPIRPEVKLQRAFEDVSDLLVLMRMPRHVIALLEVHMGNHHAIAGDQAARKT